MDVRLLTTIHHDINYTGHLAPNLNF